MDSIDKESILLHTFGWWQFAVCLFAFSALMAIWWHIGRKQSDKGQVWLAVSVLCWSLSGLVEVYYSHSLENTQSLGSIKSDMGSLKSILSLCNSFFILMALPYFKYLPNKLSSVIESDLWKYIVGIPFLLAFLPILAKYIFDRQYNFINDLDVYYSILTLIFLGSVLWESFARRRLKLLSFLSLVCIVITFVAQLYKPLDNTLNQLIFSAIFKSCLIMIFFALALSWVKELVEEKLIKRNFNPLSKDIKLSLANRHLILTGIWPNINHDISLSNKQYELLELFTKRKLDHDQWLTIKPKDAIKGKHYDIQSDNEITRLLKSILNGIFTEEEINYESQLPIIRNCFIERDAGKVKLTLLVQNLLIKN